MKRVLSIILLLTILLSTSACAAGGTTAAFADVPANASYAEAAAWCREAGLIEGVGDDRFDPDGTLTRAMLVTVLHRDAGKPVVNYLMQFADVPAETWYTEAVRWAASEKLVLGYSATAFGPNDPVSVEQLQVILDRHLGRGDTWVGDPARANPATRAQVAVALMENLKPAEPVAPAQPSNSGGSRPAAPKPEPAPEPEPPQESGGTILVACFSCTNNTKGIAEKIAAGLDNADLYEITPAEPYTSADLDYNTNCRANQEQNDPDARPEISGKVENWGNYDVVYLGYPIWWGKAPKIIHTFLESYDFAGKTVIPFCTSGSSPYNDSTIKPLAPTANWVTGQRFAANASQSAVDSWLTGLNLNVEEEPVVNKLNVTFNGHSYTATLAESNPTVEAFVQYIKDSGGSVTISAHDYGGWEKVGGLGTSLGTTDNVQTHAVKGDFVLYSGNQVVLFYGSNDWSYTLLGHLDGDLGSLKADLGGGDVEITYSITD